MGTKLLRAYMHGYFVDQRLYKKAKAITMPFAYDQYRQERVQQKLEEERRTRIAVERKVRRADATFRGWVEAVASSSVALYSDAKVANRVWRGATENGP